MGVLSRSKLFLVNICTAYEDKKKKQKQTKLLQNTRCIFADDKRQHFVQFCPRHDAGVQSNGTDSVVLSVKLILYLYFKNTTIKNDLMNKIKPTNYHLQIRDLCIDFVSSTTR